VVAAIAPLPATAKIRIGWDDRSINAVDTARRLEDSGVQRIAVHGRTKEQGYTGEANWDVIGGVVQAVQIPVIGNGDLCSPEGALERVKSTGVAGLMIGRAAMTKPWIFRQIRAALEGFPIPVEPSAQERWDRILNHCREEIAWRGDENFAMRAMRSRLMTYTKGMEGGRHLREKLGHVTSFPELEAIAAKHLADEVST